jgi:hypothetical protein
MTKKQTYKFDLKKSVTLLNDGKSFRKVAESCGIPYHVWFYHFDKARDNNEVVFFPGKWGMKK